MPSFRDFIKQSTENFGFPGGHEDYDFEEEVSSHIEKMLQNLHLGTIHIAFPDIEEVVPALRMEEPYHPEFQAALEAALREAIVVEHFGSEEALEQRKASGPGM